MQDEKKVPENGVSSQIKFFQEIVRLQAEVLKLQIDNSYLKIEVKALEEVLKLREQKAPHQKDCP